jgi:hypothetical protein
LSCSGVGGKVVVSPVVRFLSRLFVFFAGDKLQVFGFGALASVDKLDNIETGGEGAVPKSCWRAMAQGTLGGMEDLLSDKRKGRSRRPLSGSRRGGKDFFAPIFRIPS